MSVLHAALASATLFSASSGAESWEDRKGFVTEWSSGPSFGLVSRKQSSTEHLGYPVGFGAHFMRSVSRTSSHEKSGDIFGESDAVRWCMPFACMALGLLFSPPGALLGNELGFDVDATVANDMARIGVRPLLRYSKGALRSPSLVGQYTPWLAFTHADTPRSRAASCSATRPEPRPRARARGQKRKSHGVARGHPDTRGSWFSSARRPRTEPSRHVRRMRPLSDAPSERSRSTLS